MTCAESEPMLDSVLIRFHIGTIVITLTVKGIPEELHQRLRESAEAHGRSLNKEIIASLAQVVCSKRVQIPDYLSRVARVQSQIDFEVSLDEIQQAIDANRR